MHGDREVSDDDAVVCPECRAEAISSARAALSVLTDDRANAVDRNVAMDVLIDAAETLRLPTGELSAE
jgi:hypothetical protein